MSSWSAQLKYISSQLLQKSAPRTAGPETEMGMGGSHWGMPFDAMSFGMKHHELS
jgi:hypothetical protein